MGFIVRRARPKDKKLTIIIIVTQTVLYTSLEFVHKQNYTGKLFLQINFYKKSYTVEIAQIHVCMG